jgi:hypothetical protein
MVLQYRLIHAILLQENSDLTEIYVLSELFSDEPGAPKHANVLLVHGAPPRNP